MRRWEETDQKKARNKSEAPISVLHVQQHVVTVDMYHAEENVYAQDVITALILVDISSSLIKQAVQSAKSAGFTREQVRTWAKDHGLSDCYQAVSKIVCRIYGPAGNGQGRLPRFDELTIKAGLQALATVVGPEEAQQLAGAIYRFKPSASSTSFNNNTRQWFRS